ncbi:MAG: GNAT family N-acetyltransferase, partial [Candidatus Hodarchaeota archaeon]
VHDEFQGRGIGSFMLTHLMRIAKSKGVSTFVAYVHPKNQPMIRFLHQTGKIIESQLKMADEEYIFRLQL